MGYNISNIHQGLCILVMPVLLAVATTGCNTGDPGKRKRVDPEITEIMSRVSADSIEQNIRTLVGFHTRHTLSDTLSDTTGIGAARRWIKNYLERISDATGGRLQVHYDGYLQQPTRRVPVPTRIVNVVATLPGVQPASTGRMYVVSGHYDSRVSDIMNDSSYAPGADDDGSGTAAVLELARVMSHYKFDATLVFMAVAGEEQGLLGATHYAETARREGKDIAAMFTNDIIGNTVAQDERVHDRVVRVFAQGVPPDRELSSYYRTLLATGGENDTPPRQLGRFIAETARRFMDDFRVTMIYRKDRYLRGGDHSAFLEQGYPAVRFSEPHEDYRHQHQDVRMEGGVQYGDLPRYVDYRYIANVTRLNAASLAMLANAPAPPDSVGVDISKLENSTTLLWKANSEPDISGYEIVWRQTTSPQWEYSEMTGDTTRHTIEGVSKDNYIFGVRAVDEEGHKSPAVYPLPVR